MWLTSVNESIRFMSCCATAPRIPTVMVRMPAHSTSDDTALPSKTSVCVRMIA